jgi:hypothetical protein
MTQIHVIPNAYFLIHQLFRLNRMMRCLISWPGRFHPYLPPMEISQGANLILN